MSILNKRSFKETQSRILILGEINEENTNCIIADILDINDIDKRIKKEKREPIQLIITSEGGEVYRGLGLVDVITKSETPIHTICYGLAMSMALPILISGHYRKASSRSVIMYHEISYNMDTKLTGHKYEMSEMNRLNKIYEDIILNKSLITKKQLNVIKKQQKEWYITPDKAKELGIIDEII